MVVAQAARPAGRSRWRIARQNAAATRDEQKRMAIPFAQKFRHAVERKTFANRAEIKFQFASVATDGKLFLQQSPLWLRRLRLQCSSANGKRAVRGEFHLLCDFETGKNRFAQTQFFAGRKLCDLGNVAVRAEAAQVRLQFVRQRKRRLRGLRRVSFFLIRDAHLKLRRHRVMIEDVDFTHDSVRFPMATKESAAGSDARRKIPGENLSTVTPACRKRPSWG